MTKQTFNGWMVSTFGVGAGAAFILLSERGPGVVTTLKALPLLLQEWTSQSPIGLWTILAGLLLPALLSVKLYGWLAPWGNVHAKEAVIDLLGFASAVYIAYVLMPGLPGLLIGVGCASLVSTLTMWIRAAMLMLERRRQRVIAPPLERAP